MTGWNVYDVETRKMKHTLFDIEADRDGHFEVRIENQFGRYVNTFEMAGDAPDRRVYRWHVEGKEDEQTVPDPSGNGPTRVVIWTRPIFGLQGVVTDGDGNPIPEVMLQFAVSKVRGKSTHVGSSWAHTDEQGHFAMGPFDEDPNAGLTEQQREHLARYSLVTAKKEGWATLRFDPRAIPQGERDRVRVTMTRGVTLAGVLVDDRGRPLAGATVAAEYGDDWELRRGTRTDEDGRWQLETVTPAPMVLRARAFVHDAKFERAMTPEADDREMRLVAEAIRLSHEPIRHRALGLEFVAVDDEIRAAYDVPEYVHVLIWSVGEDPEALGIGRLEKGYGLWIVGEKRITSLAEAVEEFLIQPEGERDRPSPWGRRMRVVYTFWNEGMSGTNTQYIPLTEERIRSLEDLRERLKR